MHYCLLSEKGFARRESRKMRPGSFSHGNLGIETKTAFYDVNFLCRIR